LSVCADQVVHAVGWPVDVGSAADEYMGWNAYGAPRHVKFTGSHKMWRNPFARLATILPVCPVVRSLIALRSPAAVSRIVTVRWSPGFMSCTSPVGAKVAPVAVSGPGGPVGLPLRVRKAKFAGSMQFGFATAFGRLPGP
jgi:hypothetical protein